MTGKAVKKVFFPKTRLAELIARPGGILRDDAIDGALANIECIRGDADAEIRNSIAILENIVFGEAGPTRLDDAKMLAVLRQADQVVTLAGTFGYPALDTAARSLCDIADGLLRAGRHDRAPIAVHVQTMRLLVSGATVLTPEHSQHLLGELARVTAHFNYGSLAHADGDEALAATAK